MDKIFQEKSSREGLLSQYRAAVFDIMASLYEHDLTRTHLNRIGRLTDQDAEAYDAVRRELRKQIARFERIEPQRWTKQSALFNIAYAEREHRNRAADVLQSAEPRATQP